MEKRILDFKREFIARTTDIEKYLRSTYKNIPRSNASILLDLLPYQRDSDDNIIYLYGLKHEYTDTPMMLTTMIGLDNMRLFTTALALQDKDLYQPIDVQSIIEGVQKETEDDEAKERKNNSECKN